MENKILKVDLSAFFCDLRKKSVVLVNKNWQNIQQLQNHVQTLFNIEDSVILLTEDNCLIPPQESIELLKFIKELKAKPSLNVEGKKSNLHKSKDAEKTTVKNISTKYTEQTIKSTKHLTVDDDSVPDNSQPVVEKKVNRKRKKQNISPCEAKKSQTEPKKGTAIDISPTKKQEKSTENTPNFKSVFRCALDEVTMDKPRKFCPYDIEDATTYSLGRDEVSSESESKSESRSESRSESEYDQESIVFKNYSKMESKYDAIDPYTKK